MKNFAEIPSIFRNYANSCKHPNVISKNIFQNKHTTQCEPVICNVHNALRVRISLFWNISRRLKVKNVCRRPTRRKFCRAVYSQLNYTLSRIVLFAWRRPFAFERAKRFMPRRISRVFFDGNLGVLSYPGG